MAFWSDFIDTAGSTVRTIGRGAVHVGGGVAKGGFSGAKWGIGLAVLGGMATTLLAAPLLPVLFGAGFAVSSVSALGFGALMSVPMALTIHAPGWGRALGAALLIAGCVALASMAMPVAATGFGAIAGANAIAGVVGALAFGAISWNTTKWGAMIGGALGGIGRLFSFPAKEAERGAVIEQHKVLEGQQNHEQVAAYEAQAAAKLQVAEEKAREAKAQRFQMDNPLAKENGGTQILTRQKQQQQDVAVGAQAMGA